MENIVTRIAPSPTGYLHFGLARTALFNYLYARQNGGKYILRIEDTDASRNKQEFEDDIREQFSWLKLDADAVFRQSEHRVRHEECLQKLIAEDKAYISAEPAKDDPARTAEVVRLRNPGEVVTFTDLIRGEITFDTTELKDFVIARSLKEPLYHLAVVIDDNDEGVTHVVRGEDHISNTPRQMLIARALGFPTPVYAHLPLILMPDKTKMSKRKHESSVKHFRDSGILPEALINYVALLGWSPGTDREIFSLEELVGAFDITHIQKSGAVFNMEKLRWFNREYLLKMREDDFNDEALRVLEAAVGERGLAWDENIAHRILPIIRERISVWHELHEDVQKGEFDYFFTPPDVDGARLPDKRSNPEETKTHLAHVAQTLTGVSEFTQEYIKSSLWDYAGIHGRGSVLWPFRYALTGKDRSPDPFTVCAVLGKDEALRRVNAAVQLLNV